MIELNHISKSYGKTRALDDVSLSIGPGELVGLFGENGAGKTTLLKSILNLIHYQGDITLDGEPITRKNIARLSFATCEHSFFPGLTAEDHRDFYAAHFEKFNETRFRGLMDFFALPKSKPIRSFSTGQQNQFEVILALCQGADYILMDEPFAGNDIFNREDFYKVLLGILEPNETIVLSTHLIEEVSGFLGRADRCISVNSLEARVPFGDLDFVRYVLAIDPAKKMNVYGKGKYLLRHAFEGDYLPHDILYREKAAFSDAVGHSMVDHLKAFAEDCYTGEQFEARRTRFAHAQPFTKESLLYREIFEKYYPGQSEMIVDFWMPNKAWEGCDVNDPSARVLSNYGASGE